jgi:ABC-type antimicrobial peptide transport system permease subunit
MEGVGSTEWRTIVGVVGDVHQFWFEKDSRPLIYLPYRQAPRRAMYLALRTRGDPMSVLPAVREGIHRLDATLPVLEPRLMRDLMQETLSAMGVTTGMMFVFGVLALLLAAVGVYGVMAYSVTHRNREFGIRMALGARPEAVLRMVIWQGLLLTVWGVAAGLAGGFGISRAMAGIMFGVNSTNPAVLAGVPALLVGVSLVACWIPARTVTNVDPARALRQD